MSESANQSAESTPTAAAASPDASPGAAGSPANPAAPAKKPGLLGQAGKRAWIIFALIFVINLAIDHGTKYWARNSLPVRPATCTEPMKIADGVCVGERVTVIDGFWDWKLSFNKGASFSMFWGSRTTLTIIGLAAVLVMLWMMRKSRPDQKYMHWGLGLVVAGAIGNLLDRIYFGVVTDFVLWYYKSTFWPVFNWADVVLVAGVILLFMDSWREAKREKAERAAHKAANK